MQILAIIGDPIKQAQSPLAFGAYFKKHDIEAEVKLKKAPSVIFFLDLIGVPI